MLTRNKQFLICDHIVIVVFCVNGKQHEKQQEHLSLSKINTIAINIIGEVTEKATLI